MTFVSLSSGCDCANVSFRCGASPEIDCACVCVARTSDVDGVGHVNDCGACANESACASGAGMATWSVVCVAVTSTLNLTSSVTYFPTSSSDDLCAAVTSSVTSC